MHTYACMCKHVCICVHICMCVEMHACTYVHTYIHNNKKIHVMFSGPKDYDLEILYRNIDQVG